tara:strand:- start:242 stop:2629 length:2388 start_codon:yes stop_codon:yes gene_type:complete
MKTFSQLNEDSVNDRLDKLGHPKKLNSKRLKQLTLKYPAYEDIDLEQWQGYPFPRNSSVQAFNELKYLQQLAQNRTSWQEEMVEYDLKIVEPFKEYLDEYGIEVDWNRIEDLVKQSHPIILSLKRYYNRPRPNRLAQQLGLDLTLFPLKTANTPSYPSGHATQGRLVCNLVADEAPLEHRPNIMDIGYRIGNSRQIAGAHYPSDTHFGHQLGEELYRLSKTHSTIEPDLKLESVIKEEEVQVTVDTFLPPASQAGRRTTIYEGAALVGFLGESIMSKDEWKMGGSPKFRMKDWYEGHYLKKAKEFGQEKEFKDAWIVFCNELGSAKFSSKPKDFIWSRISEYYKSSPSTWGTRAFKDNTADAIVITKGTADGLLSLMKKVKDMTDEEQVKITKHDESTNMITCKDISFFQVSLKKGMGDARIGKTAPFVVDRGSEYHGLKKGIHKPGDAFKLADLQFEEYLQESLTEGFFSGLVAKVKDKVSGFVKNIKKFLSKLTSRLFSKAKKVTDAFIKRDKSVVAATKILKGLKQSGAVISEGVITEKTLKLNQATVDAIKDFEKAFGNKATPIKNQLTKMENAVIALNKKKDPTRKADPILYTGTNKGKGIDSKELAALKDLYNMKEGNTIYIGENTPFNTMLKLTSNMIGYVYINGLLDSISKSFDKYEKVDQGLSNAIIGMSVDIEGEAKFGNTSLPVVIAYGGQSSLTKLGTRDSFQDTKKKELKDINLKYNDYPILVIRINKLNPHNSVNLYLLNSVDVQGDHADPSWMNVSISTSSGSGFATKVESNSITKTYER